MPHAWMIHGTQGSSWKDGTGWVAFASSSEPLTPAAALPTSGVEPLVRPPEVSWGELPGQVVVRLIRLNGTEERVVDWHRHVRVRTRSLTPTGGLVSEDTWVETWEHGVRRPMQHHHLDTAGACYAETYEWHPKVPTALELSAAP